MLHIGEINSNYIYHLLHKLSNESFKKKMYLFGDLNIDLLKYESSELASNFLDTLI